MTELDIVIVTADGARQLARSCLDSLRAHPPKAAGTRIHVVDNASRDGAPELIRASYPEVSVTALSRNTGFGHACNLAIRRTNAPFVLLLNPDTVVQQGAVDTLLTTLERHPRAGIAGPRLIRPDGSPDHNAKRSFPTPAAALKHLARGAASGHATGNSGYVRSDIEETAEGVVDAISGSCMLVRRAALSSVGLLDERYWMYGEDLDWCRRFAQHGWDVRYAGAATVIHVGHGVTGPRRSLRLNWAFHRAMGRFYRRWEAGERPLLDLAVYAAILARFACVALAGGFVRR